MLILIYMFVEYKLLFTGDMFRKESVSEHGINIIFLYCEYCFIVCIYVSIYCCIIVRNPLIYTKIQLLQRNNKTENIPARTRFIENHFHAEIHGHAIVLCAKSIITIN